MPKFPFTFGIQKPEFVHSLRSKLRAPVDESDGEDPSEDANPDESSDRQSSDLNEVIWVDGDSEIRVDLSESGLNVRLEPGFLLVELRLSTNQTRWERLTFVFRFGDSRENSALFATVEAIPRGNRLLARRWGGPVQKALARATMMIGSDRLSRNAPKLGEPAEISGVFIRPETPQPATPTSPATGVCYVVTRPAKVSKK